MNLAKLKDAEARFMERYPGGFENPEIKAIGKKHNMEKLVAFAQESFAAEKFKHVNSMAESMVKMVTRSSMVSVFEKPKFRDTVKGLYSEEKEQLVNGLYELLHGDEEEGFEILVATLLPYKLAKWTIISVFGAYYRPDKEVFFKPTTVKNVLKYFEIEGLQYKPRPYYEFFVEYRKVINEMKQEVDSSLAVYNAGFSGFLMMTMDV